MLLGSCVQPSRYLGLREALVAGWVDEGWSDKRIDCEARAGGSMLGLFCGD